MTVLTADNVEKVFMDCLFPDGTDPKTITTDFKQVDCVTCKFGFDPVKIELHKAEIHSLLKQLPKEFQELSGGGWSFLNACLDTEGKQWGEHKNIEQLLALGLAADLASFLMPRNVWQAMPGGMPYFVVK